MPSHSDDRNESSLSIAPAFNKARALMVIRNPETYDRAHVRAAAVWVLGDLYARAEDIAQASSLL
jgi:hypothetical protein